MGVEFPSSTQPTTSVIARLVGSIDVTKPNRYKLLVANKAINSGVEGADNVLLSTKKTVTQYQYRS
jgi:hypothetical protein